MQHDPSDVDDLGLPLPKVSLDGAPFWEGTRAGKLLFQRCIRTGRPVWPPRHLSPYGGGPLQWEESKGLGSIYSFSTIYRAPNAAFAAAAPYTIGFICLDEDYYFFSRILEPAETIAVGIRVQVLFVDRGPFRLPMFKRITVEGAPRIAAA